MCTIGFMFQVHPDVPLLAVANRDEFYARPSRPPERIDDVGIGGVDALSGGTWLAITRRGRIVAVTNQRVAAPPVPGVKSRGHAVRGALAAPDLDAYVAGLDPREFASMNLAYGDATNVRIAYFRREAATKEIETLTPGIHVLCNDRLGAAGFPRGVRLRGELERGATVPWPELRARIAATLGDHQRAPIDDADVPPWIGRDVVEATTSICIHSPLYGTKSSAIVALGAGRVIQYLHAEGPPCVAPFVDYTGLAA